MFGYQFIHNELMSENQKNVQLTDITSTLADKKSSRVHFVKSYNKLSIMRFVKKLNLINRYS